MKLSEWLREARKCPDEFVEHEGQKVHRLTYEFGVYDNFPIVFGTNLDTLVGLLKRIRNLSYIGIGNGGSHIFRDKLYKKYGARVRGFHNPISLLLMNISDVERANLSASIFRGGEQVDKEKLVTYTSSGTLFPDFGCGKQLARTVEIVSDLSEVLIKEGAEFSLPASYGWKRYLGNGKLTQDGASRIVYWPDEVDAEICRLRLEGGKDDRS